MPRIIIFFALVLATLAVLTTSHFKSHLPRHDPVSFDNGLKAIKKDPSGFLHANADGFLCSFATDGALVDTYHLGRSWVPSFGPVARSTCPERFENPVAPAVNASLGSSRADGHVSSSKVDTAWAPGLYGKFSVPQREEDHRNPRRKADTHPKTRPSWFHPSMFGKYSEGLEDLKANAHQERSWVQFADVSSKGKFKTYTGETPSLPSELEITAGKDFKSNIPRDTKLGQPDIDAEVLGECGPAIHCVDSSTCGGGCGACTYVGWFPYGVCLAG